VRAYGYTRYALAASFAGSDADGERVARFHELLNTAKLNGLDPKAYLACVLERIADCPVDRIELLP